MSPSANTFIEAFLLGFLTNLWIAAGSLVLGMLLGSVLAWLRHRLPRLGQIASLLTSLLRASPTFVVMFFLLNTLPPEVGVLGSKIPIPAPLVLILALSVYVTAYVSDNLLDTLRHLQQGSTTAALMFVPIMMRAFITLVMSSSTGAAIGVREAVTVTLQQADRLPTMHERILLVLAVILFFAFVMYLVQRGTEQLTFYFRGLNRGDADGGEAAARRLSRSLWLRRATHYSLAPLAVVTLVLLAAFLAPMPPAAITIETGPIGGSWYHSAEQYRDYLEDRGIRVRLRPRNDSIKTIEDVNDDDTDTDVGFTLGEGDTQKLPNITTLGGTDFQILFGFVRRSIGTVSSPAALRGLRIALPSRESATSDLALAVLGLFGVTAQNSQFSFQPITEQMEALKSGQADAGFLMVGADNPLVAEMARRRDLTMLNFPPAAAVAAHFPGLRAVVVPAAAFDLIENVPPTDLNLVAGITQVVVRHDLHPAIVYLLLDAMASTHRRATAVSRDGEFPSLRQSRLPANDHAKDYYQAGVPWIYRNLPMWLTSIVEYYLPFIVPVLLLAPLYNWMSLPNLPEILVWLRSAIWLRALRDLEARLARGGALTRRDIATMRLIQTALEPPDLSAECRKVIKTILEKSEADPPAVQAIAE